MPENCLSRVSLSFLLGSWVSSWSYTFGQPLSRPPLSFSVLCSSPPAPPSPGLVLPYLVVGLTGREEGLKCGSKPNDIEEAGWHEALKSHQHGILAGKKGIFRIREGVMTSAASHRYYYPSRNLSPHRPSAPPACTQHPPSPQIKKSADAEWRLDQSHLMKFLTRVASLTFQSHSIMVASSISPPADPER